MAFEQTVEVKVSEDGQIEVLMTDTWGTKRTVLSRKKSREVAEKLIEVQNKT